MSWSREWQAEHTWAETNRGSPEAGTAHAEMAKPIAIASEAEPSARGRRQKVRRIMESVSTRPSFWLTRQVISTFRPRIVIWTNWPRIYVLIWSKQNATAKHSDSA
jgi:hypothetical protein